LAPRVVAQAAARLLRPRVRLVRSTVLFLLVHRLFLNTNVN